MLDHFRYIGNIGRFETVVLKDLLPLKRLSLIYSENGRGKTTLCSILRSMSSSDPTPILERKRLSAKDPSRVVINVDGKDVAFDGAVWNAAGPRILIFDEHFIDTNIYSGLTVTAGHRQSIHELVIGEEGVKLNRKVQDLTTALADLQTKLKEAERALPSSVLGGLSLDDFCALKRPDDLKSKLDSARKAVSVLRDAEKIRTTPEFGPLALPSLPIDAVDEVLKVTLPEIETAAVEAVKQHLTKLKQSGAERWVSEGMENVASASSCPFCGQNLDGSTLIAHYQAYFSAAYRDHREKISQTRDLIQTILDGDRLARFQRTIQETQTRHAFWGRYIELPAFSVDTEEIAGAWVATRNGLLDAINRKLASPLDSLSLNQEVMAALSRYKDVATRLRELSSALLSEKPAIDLAKEHAVHGNLSTALAQVAQLETIERRHDPDTSKKCLEFLKAKLLKVTQEEKKEEARKALNEHRDKVFVNYQTTINDFLLKFNADFRIDALRPSDAGGVTSSGYDLVVNKTRIGLASSKTGSEPSFRTGLSAGDRNTLALAFFFTTLRENAALLPGTIVAFDDPASSLDDGRALSTSQEIRDLLGRTAQVIVLSHSRPLLCQLWERADKNNTATLQIRNAGPEMSTLEPWDAEAAAVSEYDRLHKAVRAFADSGAGQPQAVAPALRMILESFLRVAFVEYFPPGTLLGAFQIRAKQLTQAGTPILSAQNYTELDNLREYANQFHHDTSKTWQENLSNVNETQLNGYAKRVIDFTRKARSS